MASIMRASVVFFVGVAGCFSPSFDSGKLQCAAAGNQCPPGYYCAGGLCWKNGAGPGAPDLSASTDDGGGGTGGSGGGPDLGASKAPTGTACTSNDGCVTGFCADGVCCDQACTGECQACNQSGSVGSCTPMPKGQPSPTGHAACSTDAKTGCQHDGLCDGKGGCELWPQGTVCKDSVCDGSNNYTAASTCDGLGVCKTPHAIACAPYVCKDPTQCWPSCTNVGQCQSPNTCTGGSCGKKSNGQPCGGPSECLSNVCADGVCCNVGCGGVCQACNLSATLGTCSAVTGAPAHGSCAGYGSTCGSSCDGSNQTACTFTAATTGCNDGNACTYNDVCDGNGTCAGSAVSCPASSTCASYSCNGTSTCSVSYAGAGTGCNDGNVCTYNDVCNGSGACGGTAIVCNSDSCTSRSCNGTSSCSISYRARGTVCGSCHCGTMGCDGSGSCTLQQGCVPPANQCP